jgi:hypothetical protein
MADAKEILGSLGPSSGGLHWSIMLYWIFLINLIIMLMEGSSFGTNIGIVVMICAFIDKTWAFGYMFNPENGVFDDPEICHTKAFVGTYLIRVFMFAGPFTIAGATKNGKVRGAAILAGLSGVAYMIGRWYLDQRDFETSRITCLNTDMVIQSVGLVLVLAKIALRDCFHLGTIHRHIPCAVTRQLTPDELEV